MKRTERFLKDFEKSLKKLEEVLNLEKSEIVRDSAIKRFELCFDTAWKTLKAFLEEYMGIICRSPKGCFREAFFQGLIDYDEYWLRLVDLRNMSVHTYQESLAEEIYSELLRVVKYLRALYEKLSVGLAED